MEYRSTNYGFASPKDIQSNVGSSCGVQLSGGSTGATVSAVGTDDNIPLNIVGKGTGGVRVGSTSGAPFKGAFSTTFAWAVAALSSGATEEVSLASTTCDVDPGDVLSIELGLPAVSTQTLTLQGYRTSTVATSRVTLIIGNITSTAVASTASGTGRISWIDLT